MGVPMSSHRNPVGPALRSPNGLRRVGRKSQQFIIMISPKRTKFRKYRKGTIGGIRSNDSHLGFGRYGVKTLEAGQLSARLIEASRRIFSRTFRRKAKMWIRIFPDIGISAKPAEVRIGKGKGSPAGWTAKVQAGQLLFEFDAVSLKLVIQATQLLRYKFPLTLKVVSLDS